MTTKLNVRNFVFLLRKHGYKVTKIPNYKEWLITGKGIRGQIVLDFKKYYNANFFVDNIGSWNKPSSCLYKVDFTKVGIKDLVADMATLGEKSSDWYNQEDGYTTRQGLYQSLVYGKTMLS